ncbi:hypothetical protein ACFX1Q_028259 [Malus domestica]
MPPMPKKNRKMAADACRAMKEFGISEVRTRAGVRELLKLYENNWELIVEDNHRVLLEFLLEGDTDNNKEEEEEEEEAEADEEIAEQKGKGVSICESKAVKRKNKAAPSHGKTEDVQFPIKRYCTRQQTKQALSPLKCATPCLAETPSKMALQNEDSEESEDSQPLVRRSRRRLQEGEVLDSGNNFSPVCNRNTQQEESLNMMCEDSCSDFDDDGLKFLEVKSSTVDSRGTVLDLSLFDVESSPPKGELEMSLICHPSLHSDFDLPHSNEALELLEETCMKSYGVRECVVGTGFDSTFDESTISRDVAELKNSDAQDVLESHYQGNDCNTLSSPSELFVFQNLIKVVPHIPKHIAFGCFNDLHRLIGFSSTDIESICGDSAKRLVIFQGQKSPKLRKLEEAAHDYHSSIGVIKSGVYIEDITRGEERVKISLEDGKNVEDLPNFLYIRQSLVYKNASVKFSLGRMSHDGCYSRCYGDCLTSPMPCVCASETGGQFAYTPGGLVKEMFLEKCIALKREPIQHHCFYCRECPLEKSKYEKSSVACKGHLLHKFIKECWHTCGCNKNCGNRIVQQGISGKLQVFLTPEGKGWGLRTLEDLPRGAFVCEYVGEILTNTELHERNVPSTGKKHAYYAVPLDAGWGVKGVLKDEEALCLDATVYGNVARFINHRCSDATLVEIPVEVETPDRHYYHLALFTTRNIAAMEELTWDYGIDFRERDHPMTAFQCLCGSPLCRDRKESKGDVQIRTYARRRRCRV